MEKSEAELMFEGAIKLQEGIKEDADRRIEHYRWAIAEIHRQEAAALEVVSA